MIKKTNYIFRWDLRFWWRCVWGLPVCYTVLWGWTPYSLVYIYRRFRRTCCLHRQDRWITPKSSGSGIRWQKISRSLVSVNCQVFEWWVRYRHGLWMVHVTQQWSLRLADGKETYIRHSLISYAVNQSLGLWLSSEHRCCSAEGVSNTNTWGRLMDCVIVFWS